MYSWPDWFLYLGLTFLDSIINTAPVESFSRLSFKEGGSLTISGLSQKMATFKWLVRCSNNLTVESKIQNMGYPLSSFNFLIPTLRTTKKILCQNDITICFIKYELLGCEIWIYISWMEWASLSAFYMRDVQGLSRISFLKETSGNGSVLSLTSQPPVQCNQGSPSSLQLMSLTWLMA